jgi:GNAT superfamily N-acetyltransferase
MEIIKGDSIDKQSAIQILANAFQHNPAVNDTLHPSGNRDRRMAALMSYLVDTAIAKDGLFLTDDNKGAFLLYDPVLRPNGIADTFRQLKLVNNCIGWSRLSYASAKDKKMRSFRPAHSHLYLSMIGTMPDEQNRGTGKVMLEHIKQLAKSSARNVYLETSVTKNVEWYLRHGFTIHGEWKIRDDYHVRFMNFNPE